MENIAYQCVDKICGQGLSNKTAIRWIDKDEKENAISYGQISSSSNKIAAVLKRLGVNKGDCVSIFLPRSTELISSFFAIMKLEAVACILFSTFGESALLDRLADSRTKIIITKNSLAVRIKKIVSQLNDLAFVLVIDSDEDIDPKFLSLPKLLRTCNDEFEYAEDIDPETPAFIQYTSGSTGKPKGALHVHQSIDSMIASFKEVFALEPGEKYWCTADPAWITGLVYGIIAPLACQTDQVQYTGIFTPHAWLSLLEKQKVSVWYTAPTALRILMKEELSTFKAYDFSSLSRIFSVGEPLNPEIYHWGKKVFGREIYDNWFQSETGSIMISNKPAYPVKPGSMGKPLSTIRPIILGEYFKEMETGRQGHLCLAKGWPSMFRSYINKDALYREKFRGDIYISGDLAYKDEDGYFWYVSRSDDVINTAGHLVGPFEVESVLLEIEEINDVAVIGAPDPTLHQKIVAFVCLKKGVEWDRKLELKCRVAVANKVSTTAAPQEFIISETIPKNKSGKILRRVLKARYAGEDPGDISTIEEE
jgi:acetyl-CoA synthetase